MRVIAAKLVAVSLIALAVAGQAHATAPSLTGLDLTGVAQAQDPYYLTFSLYSGIGSLTGQSGFVAALTSTWQSYGSYYGASAGVTQFESSIASYYANVEKSPLDPGWTSTDTAVFQSAPGGWSLSFNADAGTYQLGKVSYSLNAPGPVAGAGLFTLIAAASLVGFAMRRRGGPAS